MALNEKTIVLSGAATELQRCRREIIRTAAAAGFYDEELAAIVSAVFEACANAVTHGCPIAGEGTATLRLKMYSDRFVAVVEDSGSGFVCPFEAAMPPASSRRGRGIPMMKLLMDEVRFDSGGGCTVTLVKYLRPTTAH